MDIAAAQRDLARAYAGGAPGAFVSGVAWLAAGLAESRHGAEVALGVLFVGGMLIVPVSLLIARLLFGAGKVMVGNPLERLGLETTFMLFAGLLISYVLMPVSPQLAFPVLVLAIGARYFAFRTIYGEPTYWMLGGALAMIGTISLVQPAMLPLGLLLLVGITECAFAAILLVRWRRRDGQPAS